MPRDAMHLGERAMRARAVMEPRVNEDDVERVAGRRHRFGVLDPEVTGIDTVRERERADRDVVEAEKVKDRLVERSAARHEHRLVAADRAVAQESVELTVEELGAELVGRELGHGRTPSST